MERTIDCDSIKKIMIDVSTIRLNFYFVPKVRISLEVRPFGLCSVAVGSNILKCFIDFFSMANIFLKNH